jgi:aminobenzoyl-glutamate transport protein
MANEHSTTKNRRWLDRFLSGVEWLGNLLPHPVVLFALFAAGTVVLSGIAGGFGWAVADPRPEGFAGRAPDGMIRAISLINEDGLRRIIENLVKNFVEFAPLGTVLVALLGVSISEHSGLLTALIRSLVLGAPKHGVTLAIVFAGVLSNAASEVGYVVIVPLGAAIFYSLGRHPLAGLAAAFAGVSGGYSANLVLGTVDPLLAGITQEAARMIDPTYEVHPAVNWYFMAGSTFVVTLMGTLVTSMIVEPRLPAYDRSQAEAGLDVSASFEPLSALEKRGLVWAGVSVLAMTALLVYLAGWSPPGEGTWPFYGSLRDPKTGDVLRSPLLRGVVALIFVFFLVPGLVYGRVVGTMKNSLDVVNGMTKTMSGLGMYIVLVFFAAQFVKYFEWSNLGAILAVLGANGIRALNLDNPLIFAPFILVCCLTNLLMGSASAKWAVTAPIFVPMLMLVGFSPEIIQCAFRIGDSATNVITPMMTYFGIIYAFACRYQPAMGMGTLISLMLPYSVVFTIGWTLFFYLWVFVLGIPVGPAAPVYITIGQ